MCCPCGNLCCGSDEFGGCGCEDCLHPACRRGADDVSDPGEPDLELRGRPGSRLRCAAVTAVAA